MAKRPDLSSTQRKIVNRYYEHLDTISIQKLQEAVSELYLAEGKAADRIWKRVETALAKTSASDANVRTVLAKRDVTGLAHLVAKLA
ncbi:MAG: hypothetical protein IPJ41_04730 [Phycisphaerales bacterium]|nr:hypothetical protein [Phycisphaerales bacterium]